MMLIVMERKENITFIITMILKTLKDIRDYFEIDVKRKLGK